jgi:hypothetical protein
MDFIKKNGAFCALIIICLLASAAGAYFAFAESGKVSKAQTKINSAEAQLKSLLVADPAPSAENVAASEQNVVALTDELKKIRENLQRGARINVSSDGVGVSASIQQYISEYQRRAADNKTPDGVEAAPVVTPDNFGFGFEKYIESQAMLEDGNAVTERLDKQRQILSYIVNQLIAANPAGITSVKREMLENVETKGNSGGNNSFRVSEAVSARVPGAINTMGFSVTFTGYSNSLRMFLNNLAKFELPIVVRSIEVNRPAGSATTAVKPKGNALDDIFGAFAGSTPTAAATPVVEQQPVISENISSFTVVLEFIEIILPTDSENNPS